MTTQLLTGYEPRLSSNYTQKRSWRLSLRNLGTMLNVLPPQAISLDAAAAALYHKEFYVRYNAAQLLSRRGDRDARLIMQQALTDGSPPTRASVARFLHGFSWYAAEPLIKQVLQDPDSRVREGVIYSLCDYRLLSAYQLMVTVLQDEADNVRSAAVWGLRECRDPAAVPVLQAALQADDFEVRIHALEILGLNDMPEAIPVVRQALIDDSQPEVKYAATLSWLELSGESCLPPLMTLIEQTRGSARRAILQGFFHATNYLNIDVTQGMIFEQILHSLELALTDEDPQVKMAVAWPLTWMHHPQATALLKNTYYNEEDDQVKAHILFVAINLLSEAGDELLADGLRSRIPALQEMAVRLQKDLAEGNIATGYE